MPKLGPFDLLSSLFLLNYDVVPDDDDDSKKNGDKKKKEDSERHRRLTPAEKKVMAVYRKVMRQHFKAQAKALLEHLGGE